MATRTIQLHIFASSKGGVGKSTLAVMAARHMAVAGRRVALFDLDLSGSSLADGLRLVAPDVALTDTDQLDFAQPPGGFLSRDDTLDRRWMRYPGGRPEFVPFLNEAFDMAVPHADAVPPIEALCWRAEPDDKVAYFPSSPLQGDVEEATNALFWRDSIDWPVRLSWLVQRSLEQLPDLDTLVFDLSPGLFGAGRAALALGARLVDRNPLNPDYGFAPLMTDLSIAWDLHPWLITTPDHDALLATLGSTVLYDGNVPDVVPLVNRAVSPGSVRRFIERELPPELRVEERLVFLGEAAATLGRIFQGDELGAADLKRRSPDFSEAIRRIFVSRGDI